MEKKENNWDLGITFAWWQLEIKPLYLEALIIILFTELSKTLYALGINTTNPCFVGGGHYLYSFLCSIFKNAPLYFFQKDSVWGMTNSWCLYPNFV